MCKGYVLGKFKNVFLLGASLILFGCAGVPPSIRGNGQPDLQKNFNQLQKMPNLYIGQQVRLGGMVVNVINQPHETLLEIAVLPLNGNAKPDIGAQYQGRLLARTPAFLDSINFRNHYVTLLGNLTGSRNGWVGNATYQFITMNIIGYQVWQEETRIIQTPWVDYGIGPIWPLEWSGMMYFGGGWYDPPLQIEHLLSP